MTRSREFQHIMEYSETTIRVRYAETDQMGVVYHGNYFTWFEVGRVDLCRQLGFEYKKMETEDDSYIVVADAHCRFKRPARFDDLLVVRTKILASQRRTVKFGYEIVHQESREVLATGDTLHVFCDKQGRPKSLPEKYRKYFTALKGAAHARGEKAAHS
ncbi:MAG: thioesterase family protein [Candidatus Acidiferrales bacterium]|jgi:acyl-CoA thioester hydrolase